ncbi:PEP-CTERM sorting domain-containing protein [Verrucomicrobiaceae bacterium 227]
MLKVLAVTAVCGASANATLILSTDFSGRSVSGTTASDITWVTNGVSDPGDLTVINATQSTGTGDLFDTANAAGYFAVANNVGNGGIWYTDIAIDITGGNISLETVDFDVTHFSGAGAFQGASVLRSVDFTVEVIGSTSGSLGSITGMGDGTPHDSFTVTFASPILLTNAESYDLRVTAAKTAGTPNGNNTGIDRIAFNGTAIPEPTTSTMLMGLAGLLFARRRSA